MIVTGPDVADALAQEGEKLFARPGGADLETLRGLFRAEDGALRLAIAFESQQAAMKRIRLEKQAVIHFQRHWSGQAFHHQGQFVVRAIAETFTGRLRYRDTKYT